MLLKAWQRMPLRLLAWCVIAFLSALPLPAPARGDMPHMPEVHVLDLPHEARETLQLIRRNGPYPHERDGITFGNHEKRLPAARRGHYSEYTVMTPGVRHRGARRIVVGCERQASARRSPGLLYLAHCRDGGEFYYTADHYRTFRRIVE